MLALLVLVGGLHHTWAGAFPKDTNYVTRQNALCSTSAFFFQREMGSNSLVPDICYLCFCENNGTAVCWRRENRGCSGKHYQDFTDRNSRVRRSPLSLGELFVRDAARDFFNKQSPEQCKPFESSFSDGCPPADWCIGCTVCDCDANGRWDCHILSFCSDKNGKKQMNKRRGSSKNRIAKRQSKTSTAHPTRYTKNTTKPPKKPTRKRSVNSNIRKNQAINKHKIDDVKATKINKFASVKKSPPKLQNKKGIPNRNKVPSRSLYIKRNITSKPLNKKAGSEKNSKNNTIEVAQKVVKQFMTTMQKVFKNVDKKANNTLKQGNKVYKRQSSLKQDKKGTNKSEPKTKFLTKPSANVNKKDFGNKYKTKYQNSSTGKYSRRKRQVFIDTRSSHKNDSNYSHEKNLGNKTDAHGKLNRTIYSSTGSELIIPNIFENGNNQDQEIYVTDNHIYQNNQQGIVKNITLHNDINNTLSTVHLTNRNYKFQKNFTSNNVSDVLFLSTNKPNLSTTLLNDSTLLNISSVLEKNKNNGIETFVNEKKYSHVSTQTEYFNKDHKCKLQIFLQKLMGTDKDQHKNKLKKFEIATKKPKKYTTLSKIKRLIKKIFDKKNKDNINCKDDLYYSYFNYNMSDNYKLNLKSKEKLRQKIMELKSESDNIFKTIGIIKGLLRILEIKPIKMEYEASTKYNSTNENINKLNLIIKNTDYNEEINKKLSGDQRTQIKYIKDNIQDFIKSIGKFAKILDDVIQIAMCYNTGEKRNNDYKVNKNYNSINTSIQETTQSKLEKLKKLILNYNILQNKFIRQIYVVLSNLEANDNAKNHSKYLTQNVLNTEKKKTNTVETNSANIIRNIRKLKLLAETINVKKRQKREKMDNDGIDDDEALEYLLILMEYLLKKQTSRYYSVDDGIGLLIEAIKSAPEIKLIRKKMLDNKKVGNIFVTRTTTPMSFFKTFSNFSIANILREKSNISSQKNKNKIKIRYQSDGEDHNNEESVEKIYRAFKSEKYISSTQKQEEALLANTKKSVITESYFNVNEEASTRNRYFGDSGAIKYEAIDDSSEEGTTVSSHTTAINLETPTHKPITSYNNVIDTNIRNELRNNSYTDRFLIDAKANIDWIEENFRETKPFRVVQTISSTPNSMVATRTYKYTKDTGEVTNKNEKMSSTEETKSKKQMDLLNSFNYVEDEIESKDDTYI